MLEFDKRLNLIKQAKYKYSLQNVAEPNLYREIYDYKHIPKIAFNMRHVPEDMPDEIWMTDTTFRDGQQSTSPFTVKQIVDLYKLMSCLGGPKGLVRQSEFFIYSKKDKQGKNFLKRPVLKPKKHPSLSEPSIVGKKVHIGSKDGATYKAIYKGDLRETGDKLTFWERLLILFGVRGKTKEQKKAHKAKMKKWHNHFKK